MVGAARLEPTTTTPQKELVKKLNSLILNDFIVEMAAYANSVENSDGTV